HVRVRLRPATPQGLTALVWLPDTVIERIGRGYAVPPVGWSQPFTADGGGPLGGSGGPLQSRRTPGSISTRSALEGRRAAVGAGPAQLDPDAPGSEPEYDRLSNWFRTRRISATGVGTGNAMRPTAGNFPGSGGGPATGGWGDSGDRGDWATVPSSPLPDDGWHSGTDSWVQQRHAAEIIADPIRGEQTAAGLPV